MVRPLGCPPARSFSPRTPSAILRAGPEIILTSWLPCPFVPGQKNREHQPESVAAVGDGRLHAAKRCVVDRAPLRRARPRRLRGVRDLGRATERSLLRRSLPVPLLLPLSRRKLQGGHRSHLW